MSKFYFECTNCGKKYASNEVDYLCPDCEKENTNTQPPKGVLKTIYEYEKIRSKTKKQDLFDNLEKDDFLELLPINSKINLPFLRVGKTPLYKIDAIDGEKIDFEIFLKDDSQNPTFSFKDRASYIVSGYAKENRINTIVAASTGNAGSSLAGICASQKQKAIIFVPASAPKAKLTQIVMYGAQIIPVAGTYDDAFDLSIEATKKFGWYNRNTAFNPFTIEGKKTVSFEIFSQLGKHIPNRIFVPVGDGVIISGVYKGFEDLLKLGIINKIPTIVAVQSEGSSNIINNIDNDKFISKASNTIADSIAVDIPRNYYMAKNFIKKYKGEIVSVSDDEIMKASLTLSKNTGIFSEPAAAAAFAGILKYKENKKIKDDSKNVVLLTGSGLKDLNSVQSLIDFPNPINPNLNDLEKILSLL